MNCNYKVHMKDIQNKYKFKIFCAGNGNLSDYYTKNETNALLDAKYDKHTDGIPKADLSNDVQTSLGKADTALQQHQDISGKEDKTNKVTSLSSSSTDTQYPSAKAVYTNEQEIKTNLEAQLDETNERVARAEMVYNALPKVNGSGEVITLDNTAETPLKMELGGNTSQETTSISGGDEYDSPSPDHPQEVKVVKGENTLKVEGKNLLSFVNQSKTTDTGITYTIENGKITLNGTANATTFINATLSQKTNTGSTYTFSANNKEINSNITIRLASGDNFGEVDSNSNTILDTTNKTKTFVASQDNTAVTIRIAQGTTLNNFVIYLQLEKNSSATTYEPYQSQTYNLSLGNIELCKIGNYQDFPFHAINGNDYYDSLTTEEKNALTYGSWYKHKEIGKVVLDGINKSFGGQMTTSATGEYRFRIDGTGCINSTSGSTLVQSYCNKLIAKTANNTYSRVQGLAYNDSSNQLIAFIEEIKTYTLEQANNWLETNILIILYILATPTNEAITDTTLINQLNAIEKAYAYQNQTNISQSNNDKPFIIDAETVYDLSNLVTRVAILETE